MSFDLLAPHYGWMETVLAGRKLQRCRLAFLDTARASRHALLVGEGHGRFLAEFLRANARARAVCVEGSGPMIRQSRARLERAGLDAGRVEFVQADALAWAPPENTFDLIATHFFLDCFRAEQLETLVARLARGVTPGGHWLLSDFGEPPGVLMRARARLILRSMYLFFCLAAKLPARRLEPPDPFLRANGFELRERQWSEWGLLHSDLWTRLTDLKKNAP
ncbi:MAG TPA: class I SAM-dependent methyltransferase [Verrucomicrobiae bacterium]|nr:class I SAM-dependent methyltransferase [Verrucomicrobiae bacterium]